MGKSYLGVCEDTKRNGVWVQTLSVPEGDYNTLSGSIWRGVKARIRKPKSSYEVYTIGFKSFQEFVEWHKSQPGYGEGWHLDKDLLSGELTYSPDTCCLLPATLNVLMQGVGSWKRGELVGSSYFKRDGNWRAYGNDFYKQVHLGYYPTQEEAHRQWKLDKANRLEAYPKEGLSMEIQNALKNLVDRLKGSDAEYTNRHGNPAITTGEILMNEQGKKALIRVAEWLEAGAQHVEVGGHEVAEFDMEQAVTSGHCGTACCIAGALVQFEGLIEPVKHGSKDFFDEDWGVGPLAQAHLGIDYYGASQLFLPWEYFDSDSYSEFSDPQRAAKVIRHYLETGEVNWDKFPPAPEFCDMEEDY